MVRTVKVVGFDFDQTLALTFDAPLLGVPQAYEQSIRSIWGDSGWNALGTFRNQAPIEIGELIRAELREQFATRAQAYYSDRRSDIDAVMLKDVGTSINFTEGNILNSGVEILVRRKLELLLPNIGADFQGSSWPHLTPGAAELWKELYESPDHVTAIISSGHDVFIHKVFNFFELPQPDMIVSDDFMRRQGHRHYKPDPVIWDYVLLETRSLGCQPVDSWYFGDSRQHDGGLARNAMINFRHFAAEGTPWHGHEGTFADWSKVRPLLFPT